MSTLLNIVQSTKSSTSQKLERLPANLFLIRMLKQPPLTLVVPFPAHAGAILQLQMFLTNNVWLQFFLFWIFGMAMTSFACCISVFLQSSQSAGNASLAMILVRQRCSSRSPAYIKLTHVQGQL